MLETKNTVIEMKNALDGLINSLDTDEERISEREDMTIETSKTEKQRKKKKKLGKNRTEYPRKSGKTTKGITHAKWGYQKEKKKEKKMG